MSPIKDKTLPDFSLKSIVSRSAALIGSKTVQDSLLSILFIWLARTDQSGYGLIMLGLSNVILLRSLQSMGLDNYTLRELSSSSGDSDHTGSLLRQMTMTKVFISCGAILIFLIFSLVIKQWPLHQVLVVLILLLSQSFEGLANTFFNIFRAEGKAVNEGVCRTAPNIIAFLYGSICLFFHLDILLFSLLFLISGGLKLSTAIIGARKLSFFSLKKNSGSHIHKKAVLSLGVISGVSFLGSFYNEIQIFWIRQYHGFNEVAIYKVASDVTGSLCGIVANLIIGAVLFPQLVKAAAGREDHFREAVQSFFKKIILFGSAISVFLAFFGGRIALLIYGESYAASIALIPYFAAAALFSFINNYIIFVLLAMGQERKLLLFSAVPAAISILMGPTLILKTGPLGGALSLLCCRAILSVILVTYLQKRLHFLQFTELMKVAGYWITASAVFLIPEQLFNLYLSGTLLLLIYLLLAWWDWRRTGLKYG